MNRKYFKILTMMSALAIIPCMTSCDDKDEPVIVVEAGGLEQVPESKEIPCTYENESHEIAFKARGKWHVELEDGCDWVYFSPAVGRKGENVLKVTVARNTGDKARATLFHLISGEDDVMFTVRQPEFGGTLPDIIDPESPYIDPAEIPDYDKFWPNSEHGPNILNKAAKFSFSRYKQSEHFFVFWDSWFGEDPNGDLVPATQRVDVDDLLAKAEKFFDTNINKLGMAVLGEGKSQLDNYKMQIFLLDPTPEDWVATGSGYDNIIGALWVTPATCHPVGSTIAHEIGHSFQYQVYCDKLLQGAPDNYLHGFRYGFDAQGVTGCAYWEQCAQWQAQIDYPEEMFGYHLGTWTSNCHRIFYHEWMRYASYWLQHDWVARHGVEAYGRIWRESEFPEDPIETYTRIYNGSDMQKTYDELYDYAAHMVYYDIKGVREYAIDAAKGNYSTDLYRVGDDKYQVGYKSTPGTAGFNVIRLMTSAGQTVKVKVDALNPGSALAAKDAGSIVNGDGAIVGATKNYNNQSNNTSNFRFGYVAIVGGQPQYSAMTKGANGTATYNVPADATELYFVIMGAPDTYNRVPWNDNETDDEQWPYTITLEGSDVYGYYEPSMPEYEKVDANTLNVSYDLSVDPNDGEWVAGGLNLMSTEMSEFLGVAFNEMAGLMDVPHAGVAVEKIDGKIVVFNRNADGSLSNMPTANDGYWVTPEGTAVDYGDATIYYEISGINVTLGKKGAVGAPGETMVMHPVFVYTNGGVEKTVNITINYKFRGEPARAPRRIAYSRMKKF